ncbi:MAG: PPE family protein, partial [Mycolicibacter algericus]
AARAAGRGTPVRRRRRTGIEESAHKYRYEFLTPDDAADNAAPSTTAGGVIGLAGTTTRPARASGLAAPALDAFGRGPTMPMLPDGWRDGAT